ncbi:hypothetical protein LSCM1_02933 [Leishmania martiniquensis]|uniref:Pre-mRNA-splicing factor 18 n=1 Tax=Leishmania martiniquensis TaxID=1580590 RepID=A0A836GPT5_9TRYP|nr:hypothetical protein LSCM1_02933 [Leishmania martiniquensis]
MDLEGLHGLLLKKKQRPPPPQQQQQQEALGGSSAAAAVGADTSANTRALCSNVTAADKSSTATSSGHATASSSGSPDSGSSGTTCDPYTAALQRVQSLRQQPEHQGELGGTVAGQKRSREDMEQASKLNGAPRTPTGSSGEESDGPQGSSGTLASAPSGASLSAPTAPRMKSDEDVLAQRELGVAALQACLRQLEHYWAAECVLSTNTPSADCSAKASTPASTVSQPQQQSSPVGDLPTLSVPLATPLSCPIPRALRAYLSARFAAPNANAARATGLPEMAVLNREFELLAQLKAEVEATPQQEVVESAFTADGKSCALPEEQLQLAELLRALWYLVALRWQQSLDPHQRDGRCCAASTAPPREGLLAAAQQGWSSVVYLALQNALPADVRLVQGRAVADEVDKWRALARTRQDALELLAYVCSDYETSAAASRSSAAAASFVIPAELRKSLHTMVVRHLQQEHNFMAVRQDYVDITMGTANWKLGLFSGGEVHMRRSMERVERNRIAHLLNNEHATHLLQAVRELTIFAEQQWAAERSLRFFSLFASRTCDPTLRSRAAMK